MDGGFQRGFQGWLQRGQRELRHPGGAWRAHPPPDLTFFHQWKSLLPVEQVLFSRIKYMEEQQEFLHEL